MDKKTRGMMLQNSLIFPNDYLSKCENCKLVKFFLDIFSIRPGEKKLFIVPKNKADGKEKAFVIIRAKTEKTAK